MCQSELFEDVVDRLRNGDEDAAMEVFNRFAGRLIRLARSRLDAQVRQKMDAEDVMQSVFRSFFVRQAKGQFKLDGWDSLWSLLVRITLRKCGRRVEVLRAQRRDIRREVAPAPNQDDSVRSWEAIAREPTPDEVMMLTETVEELMRRLDDPAHQQILTLKLQGCSTQEISEQAGCSERTVQRVLRHIGEALTGLA